jgi:hypothetical protein
MRVVTPDVSLWKYVTKLFDTLGGFQAVVLIACVFGVITGALMWAGGASGDNAAIASKGRWAVAGACGCAVSAVAIPKLIPLVITTFS